MWCNRFNKCLSCGSTKWSHEARGYCKKCYPIIKRLGKVKVWDENDSNTWEKIPGFSHKEIKVLKGNNFELGKNEIIRQLESRLKIIKGVVNPEDVTSLNIEYLLDTLAEMILMDKGKKLFHGHASSYNLFNDEQLKIIYKDLNYILFKKKFMLDKNKIHFESLSNTNNNS